MYIYQIKFYNNDVIPIDKIYYTVPNALLDRLYHLEMEESKEYRKIEDVDT